jgi:hypothetical protein
VGNFGVDPVFVDPDGPDDRPGTEDDNLRLLPHSPCVDVGSNGALPSDETDLDGDGDMTEPIPFDLDGNPRLVGCGIDMGAYEHQAPPRRPGDFDGNCVLDLDDFVILEICLSLSGPGQAPPFHECIEVFDFTGDIDVDLLDFAEFQVVFAG